jgi:hypothetical protein
MRGRVYNLLVQFLLGLARAVTLGSKSRRTHGHILLSPMRLPQPGGPGSRIYIPQEQGVPVIPPGTGFPFLSPLTTRRDYGGGILTRLHTGYDHVLRDGKYIIIQFVPHSKHTASPTQRKSVNAVWKNN